MRSGAVGVEHDAQRDLGEVVALGHHLGPDQHARVGLARSGAAARRGPRRPRRCRSPGGRRRAAPSSADQLGLDASGFRRPTRAIVTEPQSGQDSGLWLDVAAVVAVAAPRCGAGPAMTSQSGHSQARPQERQARCADQPRRLIRMIALPPSAPHLGQRLDRAGMKRAADALRACRATSTGGSGRPSTRSGSSRRAHRSASSRAAAWRCRPRAPRRPARRAGRDLARVVARIAPPACRRSRAPRRSRSARARRPGRTPPSAARPRSAPAPERSRRHSS